MPQHIFTKEERINRFWTYVKIIPNGCWEWQGGKYADGYGKFNVNRKGVKAHRFSFNCWNNTELPSHLLVLHKCDNPSCVNPDHLFVGSHKDNSDDKIKKGRFKIGYFLGLNQVAEIKEMHKTGNYTQQEIANKYNISRPYVSELVNGLKGFCLPLEGRKF